MQHTLLVVVLFNIRNLQCWDLGLSCMFPYDRDLCQQFFGWLNPNQMKWGEIALMDDLLRWWIYEQKMLKGQLVIWIFKELHFASWCLYYFPVFLVFASYGIWCVVLHGMSTLGSRIGGGALFLGFFLVVWWRWCEVTKWRKDALGGEMR